MLKDDTDKGFLRARGKRCAMTRGCGANPKSYKLHLSNPYKPPEEMHFKSEDNEGRSCEGEGLYEKENVRHLFQAHLPLPLQTEIQSSSNSTTQAYVRTVLKYIQARTCIDFIEDATATNRIRVFNGGGCYSSLGMVGGEQDLSLAGYCIVVGTVAHEFTHALGSLHMQSRNDRDTYITVDTTNVKEGYGSQFNKATYTINNTPYEYGSDMHYGADT
ncbi:astacin [Cooperia oncophora]